MNIKILGTGCSDCKQLQQNTQTAIKETKQKATIEKIEDIGEIVSYGVTSMPALIINDKIICSGKILTCDDIKPYLR